MAITALYPSKPSAIDAKLMVASYGADQAAITTLRCSPGKNKPPRQKLAILSKPEVTMPIGGALGTKCLLSEKSQQRFVELS